MSDKNRPYGQQQGVRRNLEGDYARQAQNSYLNWWSQAETQRIRNGQAQPLYPPPSPQRRPPGR